MSRFSAERRVRTLFLVLLSLSIGLLGIVTWTPSVFAELPITSIVDCQTIKSAGNYEIDSALTTQKPGDCLIIKAANVTVNLNGQAINGSGAGAGVHVLSSVANAYIEGRGSTIGGFAEGIEIDGSNSVAENFTASDNADAGVLLQKAKSSRVSNFTSISNVNDGVRVYSGTSNGVADFNVLQNNRYGLWLESTTRNLVYDFTAENNALAGVYIGCFADGPHANKCSKPLIQSTANAVYNGKSLKASDGSQQIGVAIDLGDVGNRVLDLTSQFNAQFDAVDENPQCGTNTWMVITYGTSNQTNGCIP
jgi:hypothetical protein